MSKSALSCWRMGILMMMIISITCLYIPAKAFFFWTLLWLSSNLPLSGHITTTSGGTTTSAAAAATAQLFGSGLQALFVLWVLSLSLANVSKCRIQEAYTRRRLVFPISNCIHVRSTWRLFKCLGSQSRRWLLFAAQQHKIIQNQVSGNKMSIVV